jgi:hypothetical protein
VAERRLSRGWKVLRTSPSPLSLLISMVWACPEASCIPAYHEFAFNRLGLSRDAGTTKRGWASTERRYGGSASEWVMNGVEECDRTEWRWAGWVTA